MSLLAPLVGADDDMFPPSGRLPEGQRYSAENAHRPRAWAAGCGVCGDGTGVSGLLGILSNAGEEEGWSEGFTAAGPIR
jgi:hypothetical protein